MPTASLTRKTHFAQSAHRYWRPEWSAEENARVFGGCAKPHGHGHNYEWPRIRGALPVSMKLHRLRLHEDATFCVDYFGGDGAL